MHTNRDKIGLIANQCMGLPVQRYEPENNDIFCDGMFNGCLSFVKFVLTGAGIPLPNFIGPDYAEHPMIHVNEFFDHFGVNIPYGKHQAGDLVFFSWDGVRPLHIGIVDDGETYIHAYTKRGIVHRNDLRIYPIKTDIVETIYDTNPIGFKRPTVKHDNVRWSQKLIT